MSKDYYGILNRIILEELEAGKKIAIFPLGRVGLEAKLILENRFGIQGIYIDNYICKYNKEVISLSNFEKYDDTYSVILCVDDYHVSKELFNAVRKINDKVVVRSCLEANKIFCDEKEDIFRSLKQLIKVYKPVRKKLIRIGSCNDGGYVMLDDFSSAGIAYSFGIGDDISWDEEMSNIGIKVYCYDHTIDKLPRDNGKLNFFKIGIAGQNDIENNVLDMSTIIKINGDGQYNNLILKMDVEGAEWDFLNCVSDETLCQFSQMTFELHGLTEVEDSKKRIAALKKLNTFFIPIWVHANNALGTELCNGIEMPKLLEITYIRKDKYEVVPTTYNAPIELDAPNISNRWDIDLIGWGSDET